MPPHTSRSIKVMSALLTPLPDKQSEFHQTFRDLQQEIRRQPGCLDCTLAQDASGEARYLLFSVWKSLAFLEAHLDSEAFRILLGATSVLTAPAGFRFVAADSAFSAKGFLGGLRRPAAETPCPSAP